MKMESSKEEQSKVLCSERYCSFTPKYFVNYIHADHTHGYSLMCGKCLLQRKSWLQQWQKPGFDEVENPYDLEIEHKEYLDGLNIRYYKLNKKDISFLEGLN